MEWVEKKKTKLLLNVDKYPDGANSLTRHLEYQCFCKKGKIVEENVVGFNDHYVVLECKSCLKKYHYFIDLYIDGWKVYLKEK